MERSSEKGADGSLLATLPLAWIGAILAMPTSR
jgi:hypothetical protein